MVEKNRYIVSTPIDATCYLAKQELPKLGHFEVDDNRGHYRELLTLILPKEIKHFANIYKHQLFFREFQVTYKTMLLKPHLHL